MNTHHGWRRFWARLPVLSAVLVLALFAGALPARAIEIEKVVSPGGITAWLVQDHQNPIVNLRFAFRGGSTADPVGKEGLADFVSGMLDEGAGDLDSQAYQRRLEKESIALSFSSSLESFGGSLRTLVRARDEAVELLRLALSAPRFDAQPLSRVRNQILVGLRQAAENPDHVANETMSRKFFPNHPYGRPSGGTPESIASITRDDMIGFVKNRFAKDNLYLGVVGDITPAALGQLLDKVFGHLPDKSVPVVTADVLPVTSGETFVIRKPVTQSAILFGHAGPMRHDPDYYAAYLLNYVLGGGSFNSRLWVEVREKRGLAYSVGTFLHPLDHAGLLLGSAGTDNARVSETLQLVRTEWQRVARDGITAKELDDAKRYVTGSYALQFTSSGRIAGTLVGLQLEGLGSDYIDKRNGYFAAVTLADVNRVAEKVLQLSNLTFIVVGQPEGVTELKATAPR